MQLKHHSKVGYQLNHKWEKVVVDNEKWYVWISKQRIKPLSTKKIITFPPIRLLNSFWTDKVLQVEIHVMYWPQKSISFGLTRQNE